MVRTQPGTRRRPRVILLQEGKTGIPVYLINAGPDEITLARMMGNDRPVFGIEAPWPMEWRRAAAENRVAALPDIEQLAARYFGALSTHAGSSRCVLAGHSVAGQIAFEVAHRFVKHGGEVAMVMLFDSWMRKPSVHEAVTHQLREIWRPAGEAGATRYAASLGRRLARSWVPVRWTLSELKNWLNRALKAKEDALTTVPDETGMPVPMDLFLRLNENAGRTQRPRCLDSHGVLFRASDCYSEFYHAIDGSKGWKGLFRNGLEIFPVEGNHVSMIRDECHHAVLADAIDRALLPLAARAG